MNQAFDPLNLLLLAVALVVFLRLRSVLGRRTGHEKPPFDPYAARRTADPKTGPETTGKVIHLPRGSNDAAGEATHEPVWSGYADEGSALAQGMEKIATSDSGFSPKAFLDGARAAYELIVTAFAQGDKDTLKPLLARDVYEGFASAIESREKEGRKIESRFVGIDKAILTTADLIGRRATVTVKFVSQLISATLDQAGHVVDGDPKEIREVTDVWTFERDVTSRDPNWKLAATGEAA
jgi:predicted lipid-binding transport protein (Tim44 family)